MAKPEATPAPPSRYSNAGMSLCGGWRFPFEDPRGFVAWSGSEAAFRFREFGAHLLRIHPYSNWRYAVGSRSNKVEGPRPMSPLPTAQRARGRGIKDFFGGRAERRRRPFQPL